MRVDGVREGAMAAKHEDTGKYKKKHNKKNQQTYGEASACYNNIRIAGQFKGNYTPCEHCGKNGHAPY